MDGLAGRRDAEHVRSRIPLAKGETDRREQPMADRLSHEEPDRVMSCHPDRRANLAMASHLAALDRMIIEVLSGPAASLVPELATEDQALVAQAWSTAADDMMRVMSDRAGIDGSGERRYLVKQSRMYVLEPDERRNRHWSWRDSRPAFGCRRDVKPSACQLFSKSRVAMGIGGKPPGLFRVD
jgi:hypothetical protein